MLNSVFSFLLYFVVSSIFATFIGYWIHRAIHQPWARWFYVAHLDHHTKQYPENSFWSEKYRDAGKNNTVYLFVIICLPLILGIFAMMVYGVISWLLGSAFLSALVFWGLVHNYFHDQFHLFNKHWIKYNNFLKLEVLHFRHHQDMGKNYGIVSFFWDKLFNTFSE